MTPLAIDLYCGLGGWSEGLLAEGYRVVGFDNEQHVYGEARYPAQLVIQDVLTLSGAQFKDAVLIVASPPCQEYSYMAMPWSRAKEKARLIAADPCEQKRLPQLFDACFRIQQEAIEAAGHFIPLVVENVCGAQKWVGRARWHFGSFYLWGDVPALMPITKRHRKGPKKGTGNQLCCVRVDQIERDDTKNDGGSWFNIAHNTTNGHGQNPDGRCRCPKVCDCQNPDGVGVAHCSTECPIHNDNPRYVEGCPVHDPDEIGVKVPSASGRRTDIGNGARFTSKDCSVEGRKQEGSGAAWFDNGICKSGSKSSARKAASAHIAKIPLELARHIARAWEPDE